jgi:lactoylglutathione lyase
MCATAAQSLPNGTSHFGIQVENLDRSVAFYRDLLGLTLVTTWVRDEPWIREIVGYPEAIINVAILQLPGSDMFLEVLEYQNVERTPIDTSNANPGTAHLAFYADDVQALYERLVAAGVPSVSAPVEPLTGPNRGGRTVYVLDPDGIRVELMQTPRTLSGEVRG